MHNLINYSDIISEAADDFGGPSLYFHQKALEYQKIDFLGDRHIEYIYATLVAWGMHRMGNSGAKMPEYTVFKSSLLKNKSDFENLRPLSIEKIKKDRIETIIEKLTYLCFSIKATTSSSYLVSGSKTLAHILPNLVCPIDREYTCKFFKVYLNTKNEQTIFKKVIWEMWYFYQNSSHIQKLASILGKPFNETYPKIYDNLIIMCQKNYSSNINFLN